MNISETYAGSSDRVTTCAFAKGSRSADYPWARPTKLFDAWLDEFIGAWEAVERFDAISKSDLTEVAGCETILARTGKSRYEGSTLGASCKNSFRGAAYAVSQTVISTDSITNWDRGFAADGTQVWGTPHGGYELRRLER